MAVPLCSKRRLDLTPGQTRDLTVERSFVALSGWPGILRLGPIRYQSAEDMKRREALQVWRPPADASREPVRHREDQNASGRDRRQQQREESLAEHEASREAGFDSMIHITVA